MLFKTALPALLLAGALAAQTVVSPAHFTGTEGNSYSAYPFGLTASPYRYVQVHDDMMGRGMKISGMALRRDGISTTSFAKFVLVCDILLSTAATQGAAPDKTFDNNHGADKKQVAGFMQVNLPATEMSTLPAPFEYKIPFSSPFAFGGKAGLCWEAKISVRQNNFTVYFDSIRSYAANPALTVRRNGKGCRTKGNPYEGYMTGSSTMQWTQKSGSLTFNGYRGPKNGTGLLLIGRRDDNLGGIPLPFELPGTAQAASKACNLYVAPFLFLPVFFNSTGYFTLNFGLTVEPYFNGLNVYSQYVGADLQANGWGVMMSDKVTHHFVAPWKAAGVGFVYAGSTGVTGTVRASQGLVVQFN